MTHLGDAPRSAPSGPLPPLTSGQQEPALRRGRTEPPTRARMRSAEGAEAARRVACRQTRVCPAAAAARDRARLARLRTGIDETRWEARAPSGARSLVLRSNACDLRAASGGPLPISNGLKKTSTRRPLPVSASKGLRGSPLRQICGASNSPGDGRRHGRRRLGFDATRLRLMLLPPFFPVGTGGWRVRDETAQQGRAVGIQPVEFTAAVSFSCSGPCAQAPDPGAFR